MVPPPTNETTTTLPATAEAPPADDDGSPWAWILGLLAIVGGGVAIALLAKRRHAQAAVAAAAATAWFTRLATARQDVGVERDLLHAASLDVGAADLAPLRSRVDAAAQELASLASTAPNDGLRALVTSAEAALRSYVFALEAEQLLRNAAVPPAAGALEQADATRRLHAVALDTALDGLDTALAPASQ